MNNEIIKIDHANSTVKKYMIASMGVGLIPIPVADIALLVGIQMKMLDSLSDLYEVKFTDGLGKKVVTSCLGSILPLSLTMNLGLLLKVIPGYGWLISGVSTATFSSAFTYAIGKLFIQHFESGSTFLTLDPQLVKEHFAKHFKEGSEQVKNFTSVKP
jgi:uncharacterized protein (DUF697 family)